eukprot:gene11705-11850_t
MAMAPMVTDVGQQGCIYNYHVTAHRPTAVTHCAVGNFTGSSDVNLIIGRSTHIDIQMLTAEGLKGVLHVPIYGVISALKLFRPKAANKDLLLVLTEHYKFAILEFNPEGPELVTRAGGDVKDHIGRPVECGQLAAVDPECRAIALQLYDGQLKVLQLEEEGNPAKMALEAFNVRLEEPTELEEGPWHQSNLDAGSSKVIPVPQPLGGAIVVGESVLTYVHTQQPTRSTQIKPNTAIQSWAAIDADGSRYLLSDFAGGLHLLVLAHADNRVAGLKVQTLEVVDTWQSLAPLIDFTVMDLERQGQGQMVACCGTFQDGSLRVVRNGIGIHEAAAMELPGSCAVAGWPV